jgi:hypothetical protein
MEFGRHTDQMLNLKLIADAGKVVEVNLGSCPFLFERIWRCLAPNETFVFRDGMWWQSRTARSVLVSAVTKQHCRAHLTLTSR